MKATYQSDGRAGAFDRATSFSPFLRAAVDRWPNVAASFIANGPASAVAEALAANGEDIATTLRRQRHGLALAVALGDLSGEFSLEQVTAALSDFADRAIDDALRAAMAERVGDGDELGAIIPALYVYEQADPHRGHAQRGECRTGAPATMTKSCPSSCFRTAPIVTPRVPW